MIEFKSNSYNVVNPIFIELLGFWGFEKIYSYLY